jgi:predicted enzyme related to lactoylglutathione lyase
MSEGGGVTWVDLTVDDAPAVRDFYEAVAGWTAAPVDMGEYADFNMLGPGGGHPVAGICHARGTNTGIPPVWMVYFTVPDLDAALEACRARGGDVLTPVRSAGGYRYAMIRDPAGAVCAIGATAE